MGKVTAALTLHGTVIIESAQIHEEVEYDEVVKERRDLPRAPEEGAPAGEMNVEAKGNHDASMTDKNDEKKPQKRFEWVDVVKKRRRTKKIDVPVLPSGVPGLPQEALLKRRDEETQMQAEMKEIVDTAEKRNDLESYIFTMRDKMGAQSQYGQFISEVDRRRFLANLQSAENWLDEVEDRRKVAYVEKLQELKVEGDPVVWRFKEDSMRPEWIAAMSGTIVNYRSAAQQPGERYGHIAPEKLANIIAECDKTERWLQTLTAEQARLAKHVKPVLLCSEMEKMNQGLAKFADAILKEPKIAPEPAVPQAKCAAETENLGDVN